MASTQAIQSFIGFVISGIASLDSVFTFDRIKDIHFPGFDYRHVFSLFNYGSTPVGFHWGVGR